MGVTGSKDPDMNLTCFLFTKQLPTNLSVLLKLDKLNKVSSSQASRGMSSNRFSTVSV